MSSDATPGGASVVVRQQAMDLTGQLSNLAAPLSELLSIRYTAGASR
jgi:hypothetical protein